MDMLSQKTKNKTQDVGKQSRLDFNENLYHVELIQLITIFIFI